jgi:hypothetical protein
MEINSTRPATIEIASVSAAEAQATRFKERKLREAQSDVRNDAVYFSPVIRINPETQAAVIQYRDEETGEVESEYPHKVKADAYQHAQDTANSQREIKVLREERQPVVDEQPEAREVPPSVDEKV